MYIGSLFNDRLDKKFRYSYLERGMERKYNPDMICEFDNCDYYTKENGNLFFQREVAWKDTVLLRNGIDLKIEFFEKVFVDYFCITQDRDSRIGGIEVFTEIGSDLKKIGYFYGETGSNITSEEIRVSVTEYVDNLIIRFNGNFLPVHIKTFDIFGGINLEGTVWPIPEKFEFKDGMYDLSLITSISATNEDEVFAAEYFKERLKENTGKDIEVVSDNADITLTTLEACDKDRYTLKSQSGKCEISGTGRRGLLFGLCALLQLIENDKVKNAEIENEDFMEMRGVHLALPHKNQVEFLKDMVKYVFIPNHYNMIFIEVAGAMRYESYPEIAPKWAEACEKYAKGELPMPVHYDFVSRDIWEKSEVRSLCDYLEAFGLEVIPEVQTWGHTQYITYAYPHLAEILSGEEEELNIDLNKLDENAKRSDVYFHTMCPNHPDYYKVTFAIIDEVLEVFKPKRYVHLGHDEVYNISECEICKNTPKAEHTIKEINALYDYVTKKNLKMMIWADMVQKKEYSTPSAINYIPKDIIMLDFVWYFFMDDDIEDNLITHGFKVVMGNMYSSHYPRYKTRSKKVGVIGAEVSTWVKCSEDSYGFEGKMFDFIYSALGICNKTFEPEFRYTYYEIVKPVVADVRHKIGRLNVSGTEKTIELKGEASNIPFDIAGIVPYTNALRVSLTNPEECIDVNDFFEVISFTHATDISAHRIMWQPAFSVGRYVLNYEDGSTVEEELLFGGNIYKYLAPYGDIMKTPYFRHEGYIGTYLLIPECGKTHNGDSYTLGNYSIKNPCPEKKVKSVTVKHSGETGAKVMVFDVKIK